MAERRAAVRFRHPHKRPLRSVTVNGKRFGWFDAVKGDVDITGMNGKLAIEARY